jgi:transposase
MQENYLHPELTRTYVGCDSHQNTHTFVFLTCFHKKLGEITVGSAPSEFPKFIKQAKKYLQPNTVFVFGFEDCSAYGWSFVKYLVERGYLVKHTNAVLVAGVRSTTLHKTDSYDAECCAKVLINEFDKLPNASPQDKYWVLSGLVTRRNGITKNNVGVKNSLHNELSKNYPHYKTFFSDLMRNSALAFYEAYPSPHHLEDVTVEALAEFLHSASKGRLSSTKASLILQNVQHDQVQSTDFQDTRDFNIRSLIRQIKGNLAELVAIDEEIEKLLAHFEYPLTSIKGINALTCAKLISEIGDIRRFKNAKALAKYSGVAPVSFSSGMTKLQMANERGNRKLNEIFYRIALTSVMPMGSNKALINPIFYDYYMKKISEGKLKNQALKCVQRRLVNIVFNVMKHQRPYTNPELGYVPDEKQVA